MYQPYGPIDLFAESTGCVTLFVRWIEDYPLPDGLKIPLHVGSYDGKRDLDNHLRLFEGAIRMQKWVMPVACHMFTYTLKDSARIWWNGSLVEFLSTHLPNTYKGLMKKTYTLFEAKEMATNGALNDNKEGFDKFKKSFSWDSKGKKRN
ncbi:hypothetical protein Tco_0785172 [Tanacetum coccineum]